MQPGSFTMGSPGSELGRRDDEVSHNVTLTRAFVLKATEVTQEQWLEVMGSNPSGFPTCGASCPVQNVTWYEAVVYCNRISAREGLEICYTDPSDGTPYDGTDAELARVPGWPRGLGCVGYRLPAEAEWEYAARAGTSSAFHSGDITVTGCDADLNLTPTGWYCNNSGGTHPVAQKQPNPWGLFDMHGNVLEWVWDWYGTYGGLATDPVGPNSGQTRVHRGGYWRSGAEWCRSAARSSHSAGFRTNSEVGLRPARTWP